VAELWRKIDQLRCMIETLAGEAIIDDADIDDALDLVLGMAVRWGHISEAERRKATNASAVPIAEQRRIVAEYIAFASCHGQEDRKRKLRGLGISSETMGRWARRILGPGVLESKRLPSAASEVRELLQHRPWQTRAEILETTGIKATSLPAALWYGLKKGWLKRRKRNGLFEWALDDSVARNSLFCD
jgi:hypothetical protein